MTKDQIVAEIQDMQNSIQAAREELSHGGAVDLTGVDGKIGAMVAAVAALDHEEALEVRPALSTLVRNLQSFAREVETRIGELGNGEDGTEDHGA